MNSWSNWKPMPSPETCKQIEGPKNEAGKDSPGVYQIRHINIIPIKLIQFGIGKNCRKRMKSFFPAPYGTGKRNNVNKRKYVLDNWKNLEYRTLGTLSREEAKTIEDGIKAQNDHLFNT